LSVVSVVGC